jgi:hypothetical protein
VLNCLVACVAVLCFVLQRAGYDKVKKEFFKRNDRFDFGTMFAVDRYLLRNRVLRCAVHSSVRVVSPGLMCILLSKDRVESPARQPQ